MQLRCEALFTSFPQSGATVLPLVTDHQHMSTHSQQLKSNIFISKTL